MIKVILHPHVTPRGGAVPAQPNPVSASEVLGALVSTGTRADKEKRHELSAAPATQARRPHLDIGNHRVPLGIRTTPAPASARRRDLLPAERGSRHRFTVASDGPARTLLINAPAGFGDLIVALGNEGS
jgi:hypothetical protein